MNKKDKIEDYNSLPVWYCKRCLSLNIKSIPQIEDSEYCEECGSTNILCTYINDWQNLYKNKYGKNFLKD